jgi:hypothetical protein
MGDRAVIWFRGNGSDGNEHGTFIYSHDGGNPRFVLKDLKEAHDRARTPRQSKVFADSFFDDSWKLGRPGYCASLLCGVDPPNFGVDTYWLTSGGQFYGDLEHIYLVTSGVLDGKLTWFVEVRVPRIDYDVKPTLANTRVLHRKQPIEKLVYRYLEKPTSRSVACGAGG